MEIKISNKQINVENNEIFIEEKKPKPKPKLKPKAKKPKKVGENSIKISNSTDVWIGGKKYS